MELMRPLLLLSTCLISSCSLFAEKEDEAPESATKPRIVGRIALVPAGENFVLIESYGPWRVPEGGVLSGAGTDGRTSNLVVTGEQLGQHAAADLRSGEAKVGDAVYYRPLGGQEDESPSDSVDPPAPAVVPVGPDTKKTAGDPPAKP
jgi:hypothetical protein